MSPLSHFLSFLLHLSALLSLGHSRPDHRHLAMSLRQTRTRFAVGGLPNVDFALPASWAGQIPCPGSKDNKLFFWLFQAESPSDDLIIWLNGGPGCSSLAGLSKENGPLHFPGNSSTPRPNPYAWTKLANVLYVDQPVGTGFSSGSFPPRNNVEITQHFYQWLKEFYREFPDLKSKNTFLTGESYAAIYIPYFTQAILANKKTLDVNLKAIVIGDGNFGNVAALTDATVNTYMQQHKDTLELSQEVIGAFKLANQHCGFDRVVEQLTYPPRGKIEISGNPELNNYKRQKNFCFSGNPNTSTMIQESVDAVCYGGCATWMTAYSYLMKKNSCFNEYNIDYDCKSVPSTANFEAYFNRPRVQDAIHVSSLEVFAACNYSIMKSLSDEFVPPPAYSIIPAMLQAGISVHIYSGDRDFLFNHIGTELSIQNMTWRGQQGFQSPPNRVFRVDGKVAGKWGAERGLTYHHIFGAGHAMPYDKPSAAFKFMRDFVIGKKGYTEDAHT